MTGNELNLAQLFPFPGKLAAKGSIAEQQALWYKGVYEDGRLQLAGKVRGSYYRLFYQDQAIKITKTRFASTSTILTPRWREIAIRSPSTRRGSCLRPTRPSKPA